MSSDYPGTLSIMVWADAQKCKSPVQKLVLYYLADNAASRAICRLDYAKLAEFCCTTSGECECAVWAMEQLRLVQRVEIDGAPHIALPWWQSAPAAPARKGLPKIEEGVREFLHEAQGGECWYCGADLSLQAATPHIDHQLPRSRGGGNNVGNLVMACAPCNITKRDKTVGEFRAWLAQRDGVEVVFHGERQQ